MAHVQKNTSGSVGGLAIHFERKTINHSNKDIDVERSHLNENLIDDNSDMVTRYQERLSEVYCLKRADVKSLATWVVTLPEELKNKTHEEQRSFFSETKNFLDNRYGEKNNVAAIVHYDETTPHLHYAFIPVVFDEKKQREKVSAKEVLNRKDLQSFHQDLDKYLKIKVPVYEKGILNNETLPFKDVKEIKKAKETIKKLDETIEKKEILVGKFEKDLPLEIRKQNNKNKLYADILKNDFGYDVQNINKAEIKPRVVLYNLDNHIAPANKEMALDWKETLEKAKETTKIPVSRLDSAIEKIKLLIQKVFNLAQDKFHNLGR